MNFFQVLLCSTDKTISEVLCDHVFGSLFVYKEIKDLLAERGPNEYRGCNDKIFMEFYSENGTLIALIILQDSGTAKQIKETH